jgi:hypothetical protein
MKIARAVFIAGYRISHACLSMQFDHYLKNIDETYIITNCEVPWLDKNLKKYLNTDKFKYIHDNELIAKYPSLNNWWIENDYRGSWLFQQALKMAAIDFIDADILIIQDPDTFCIQPYSCFDNNKLKFFILPNETHSPGYYQVLKNALGIPRQTPHCFVTEFLPTYKEDWLKLKSTLEKRNNSDCFDAIINNVPLENGLKWFSEYEFLGNWTLTQRSVELVEQKRFQYKTLNELDNLTNEYNCVCDAVPNLDDSILFDWQTETVIDFENIFNKVKKFL